MALDPDTLVAVGQTVMTMAALVYGAGKVAGASRTAAESADSLGNKVSDALARIAEVQQQSIHRLDLMEKDNQLRHQAIVSALERVGRKLENGEGS